MKRRKRKKFLSVFYLLCYNKKRKNKGGQGFTMRKKHQINFLDEDIDSNNSKLLTEAEESEKELMFKEAEQRGKTFNGLSAKEWAGFSRSVWNDVSSVRANRHLMHGATYPEKLCDRVIRMYSKEGDIVLDPFLGTGTTSLAAIKAKRNAIGIELNDKFFAVSEQEINNVMVGSSTLFGEVKITSQTIKGDCTEKLDDLDDEIIQITFTSPPYADLIHKVEEDRAKRHKNSAFVFENNSKTKKYSDDERDLGNMPLGQYLDAVGAIMKKLYKKTRKGGYNIWVVKDYRDMQNEIPYVDLHSMIAKAGVDAGFKYHDLIIWDQNQHRKLVLLGYPSRFYVNQNHSYLVVLRKW
ncbi:MAG: site-specific DNA-methyltransferase [Christensenellaceae bacterium]|jgi:DNA modification methylase|nr:site-specific DNA-methyltransferase [Christensenellaceae bacterium]